METAHRKTLHGQLGNFVMTVGPHIIIEKLNYKAFQKMYGCLISVHAPKLFIAILTRKVESSGGNVIKFSTYHTALFQVCFAKRNTRNGYPSESTTG